MMTRHNAPEEHRVGRAAFEPYAAPINRIVGDKLTLGEPVFGLVSASVDMAINGAAEDELLRVRLEPTGDTTVTAVDPHGRTSSLLAAQAASGVSVQQLVRARDLAGRGLAAGLDAIQQQHRENEARRTPLHLVAPLKEGPGHSRGTDHKLERRRPDPPGPRLY